MHQDLVNSNKEHLLTSMLFGRSPSKIVSTLLAVVEVVVVVVTELAVPDMDAMIINSDDPTSEQVVQGFTAA